MRYEYFESSVLEGHRKPKTAWNDREDLRKIIIVILHFFAISFGHAKK